jgi:hypothetical protein
MPKTGKRSFRRKNKRTMRKNMKGGALSNFTLMGDVADIKLAKVFKVSASDSDTNVQQNIYLIVGDDGTTDNTTFADIKTTALNQVNDSTNNPLNGNDSIALLAAVNNALL